MQHSNLRRILLGTTGIALALSSTGAFAQDVLETVIVTAEKQSTDIQKTSLSITAIQPDSVTASGQTRLVDIMQNVPALQVYRGAINNGAYFIRGIGTTQGVSSTLEMVDGVNTNPFLAEAMGSADAARIEVLRGPQGTLYGRGALGGVINIITNNPTDQYEGKIFVEGGAFNEVKSQATVNIPLSDDMAMRVNAFSTQMTGYMHPDGRAGTDIQGIRGKFQYKPTDDFRIVLNGSLMNSLQSGSADTLPQTVRIANFASPAFGGFNPCGGDPHPNKYDAWHSPPKYYGSFACTVPAQPPVNPNPVTGVCQQVSRQENALANFGIQADYDFGWSNLTVVGNYDEQKSPLGIHASNPFLGTTPGQNLYTNTFDEVLEARLASETGDEFKWVGGIYWEHTHNNANNWNRVSVSGANAPLGADRYSSTVSIDRSAYGQVTVPVADHFRIIGGLRYAMDDVAFQQYSINVGKRVIIPGNPSVANGDFPTHKLTYKAGIEVDVSADSLLYANATSGFRPTVPTADTLCVGGTSHHAYEPADITGVVKATTVGGGCLATASANAATVGGTPGETVAQGQVVNAVPPDSMKAYEVGSKNRFLDNRLQLNVDGYYYKFQSLYLSALGVNSLNQTASTAQAQTGTKAWGSEVEATFLLTSNDKVNIGIAYEKTESGVSPFALPQCYDYGLASKPVIGVITSTTNLAACSAKNLAANPATVNWVRYRAGASTSTPLFNAPTWNGNVGYQHVFDLESGATVTAGANVHFESSKNVSAALYYDGLNPAYHTTDLSLFYNTADGKWQLGAWVKNLENHAINLGAQSNAATSGTDYVYPTYAPPRMWGVNLSAKF